VRIGEEVVGEIGENVGGVRGKDCVAVGVAADVGDLDAFLLVDVQLLEAAEADAAVTDLS
jgi:hypothetical protein